MTELQPIHHEGIEHRLREAFSGDPETSLRRAIARRFADPAKPRSDANRLRLHPVLVTLAAASLMALGTFLYFSFVRS